MPEERLTKNERREAARAQARAAREKAEKRNKMMRWVVPTSVSVAIVAIIAVVALVIVMNPPAVQSQAGPLNMASGGILFEGVDGEATPVLTDAIPEGGTPTPTVFEDDGLAHIDAYVDFSCPACKSFEEAYGPSLVQLVAAGQATIEYHPVAILDRNYAGGRYSTRSNNAGYCVANYAPDSFLDVMNAMFVNQPSEGTTGLTNREIVDVVHSAGLENADVDQCINDEFFTPALTNLTNYQTSQEELRPGGSFSTPTFVVNGDYWDRSTDLLDFISTYITVDAAQ